MEAVHHPNCNILLKGHGDVQDLPAEKGTLKASPESLPQTVIVSYWQPSPEEETE